MRTIQTLLRNPSLPNLEPVEISSATLEDPGSESFVGHGEPVFDKQRVDEQKQKLAEEHQSALNSGDENRAAKAEQELEHLAEHIRKNVDKRGRPRPLGSAAEKVRKRVFKNYRTALAHLQDVAPSFAEHLRESIHGGNWWTYTPPTDLDWKT